jgi:tRNA G18 (ribose-2'-O)-methylase SpoU
VPSIIAITDPSDPRIESYRAIRERDLVGRQGLFIAEGKVVIEKLLDSTHYAPQSLLVAEHRLLALSPLLERVPAKSPIYAAPQHVFDAIAGFPVHRGLLALGSRVDPPGPEPLLSALPGRATILLLMAIANHDNMGGIFRNAAAFGVDAVLLDSACCDPLYRKAIRVSVGATLLVPWARFDRSDDAIALLDQQRFDCLGLTPTGLETLADYKPDQRVCIVLGAEGPGLTPSALGRTRQVRIDMSGGFDSLNVATASGIALHHMFTRRQTANTRSSQA